MSVISGNSKVTQCIESVLKLASENKGMGVSLYRTKEHAKDFNCQAWSHDLIAKNLGFVKDKLLKELEVMIKRQSEDIQLLILNEDDSARALLKHLLDIDEEVKLSNGLRNSRNSSLPSFILSTEVARDLVNYSKSYSSIADIENSADSHFIQNDRLRNDVRIYSIVGITDLVKHI